MSPKTAPKTADTPPCGQHLPAAHQQSVVGPTGLRLVFAPQPAPLPLGRHFALDIQVCPAPGQTAPRLVSVDAEMPTHRHGMNYRPTLQPLGQGRYRAEGLLWHMPGAWRWWFEFEPVDGAAAVRLSHDVQL